MIPGLTPEATVLAAFVTPLVGAMALLLFNKVPNLRETVTLITALTTFILVASLYPHVTASETIEFTLVNVGPGIPLAFSVEPLGLVYALVATLLWIPNSIYAIGYMRSNKEKHQTRFYFCFPIAIASAIGIAFSKNIFTMFVFYEALTLVTFPLVTHKGTTDAVKSGRVYLGILITTSVAFQLFAVLWIYSLYDQGVLSTMDFTAGGIFTEALAADAALVPVFGLLFFLYIYGIGKAAIMPVHRWLPAAMVAPTPVSAFLHAVAVVKAGVFCVVKVSVYVFGISTMQQYGVGEWLVIMAGSTIIIASLIALFQDNLKKRLAYSTISQLSYIVLATAIMTPISIMAATMHIVAHAFGKITLFFAAGNIYTAAHKTQVSQLDGIGRRQPWTMAAFTIGTLSMIGIPPAFGLVSKWYLITGIAQGLEMPRDHFYDIFALVVILFSTLLNAGYFLPIVYRAFFKPLSEEDKKHPHGEAPWPMVFALTFTAGLTLAFFFWHRPAFELAQMVMEAAL